LHFSEDDFEELKKIAHLVRAGQLRLYLTTQVRDEFHRNRDKKISTTLRDFGASKVTPSVPRLLASYESAKAYAAAVSETERLRNELVQKATAEAASNDLAADRLFEALVRVSPLIAPSAEALEAASDGDFEETAQVNRTVWATN
jgi:ribonuclease D